MAAIDHELLYFINGTECRYVKNDIVNWIEDNNIITLPTGHSLKLNRDGELEYIMHGTDVLIPDIEDNFHWQKGSFPNMRCIPLKAHPNTLTEYAAVIPHFWRIPCIMKYCKHFNTYRKKYRVNMFECFSNVDKLTIYYRKEQDNNIVYINYKDIEIITLGGSGHYGNPYLHFVNRGYGETFEKAMLEECYKEVQEVLDYELQTKDLLERKY